MGWQGRRRGVQCLSGLYISDNRRVVPPPTGCEPVAYQWQVAGSACSPYRRSGNASPLPSQRTMHNRLWSYTSLSGTHALFEFTLNNYDLAITSILIIYFMSKIVQITYIRINNFKDSVY